MYKNLDSIDKYRYWYIKMFYII